jgi:diguanylate cyclase (GGDEF)-like protein
MRDPRLAEIEFLSTLANRQSLDICRVFDPARQSTYGLTAKQFEEMVFHAISRGFVNGPAQLTDPSLLWSPNSLRESFDAMGASDIKLYLANRHIQLRLNHEGRLRLWHLRDELRAGRSLEPFGILMNGEYWKRDLEIAFAFMPQGGSVSVLIADLDNFKTVNDTLGHPIGDLTLKLYLQTIKDLTEKDGEAYRLGGDEVVVLIKGLDAPSSQKLAEAVRKSVELKLASIPALKPMKATPTLSGGLKTYVSRQDSDVVYQEVDALAYQAKQNGKNQIVAK